MDNISGKRLLILGGAVQQLKVVKAAKAMGVHVIVADISRDTEAKRMADEALQISVTDSESLIRWCHENPVDGVLNFCIDYAQHSHYRICHEFGFPCFGTEEQYNKLTDKARFKRLCLDNGVDVIPEYDGADMDSIELPALVKPAESSGSRGLRICETFDELEGAIKSAAVESRNGRVLIEKYMAGHPDFEIVYFVNNGKPYLAYMGDRYSGCVEDNLSRQCICFAGPSKYLNVYLKNTHDRVYRMIKELGIRFGPVFLQGFLDGDTVRFYDPGIRFPGDEFNSILKAAVGIDFMSALVRYALTGRTGMENDRLEGIYYLNGFKGALLLISAGAGVIHSFDGLETIRTLSTTVSAVQKRFIGETIELTGDVRQRVCEIAVMAKGGTQSLREAIVKTQSCLKVEDQNGENMLVSQFDANLL